MQDQEKDFQNFLNKWEDNLLAKILLRGQVVSAEDIKSALTEITQVPPGTTKLGPLLVRKRLLKLNDYTKALLVVKNQAWQLYQSHKTPSSDEREVLESPSNSPVAVPPKNVSFDETDIKEWKQGAYFGSYEILHEVARGGMGIVYKARQKYLNRLVALKVLRAGGAATEREIQRFRREAEAAGSLQHPNIVSVYEIGQEEGHYYFTMDFVEGETLQAHIKKKTRKKKLLKIMEKVAYAMAHAHQRNVVHRDIKPSNIIISTEGEPKITDFGLAKKMDADLMLTESGATMGTPYYMSPEQILGAKDVDGRTDIYSMGVLLYEIITSRLPFNSPTVVELYHKIAEEEPVPPSKINRSVDKDIETICLKCMEKDPQQRYQTAQELAEDLARYNRGESITARRASIISRISRKIVRYRNFVITFSGTLVFIVALALLIYFYKNKVGSSFFEHENKQYIEAKTLLEEGKYLIRNHNFDGALNKFEMAIQVYPQLKESYINRGDIYQAYKDYQKALKEYDRVLKIDKHYAPLYLKRGECYKGLKEWTKAIEEFSLAIQYNPEYLEAYQGRHEAYIQRGQEKQDPADFEKSIKDFKTVQSLQKKLQERK